MIVLPYKHSWWPFFLGCLLLLPYQPLCWAKEASYRLNPGDKLEITVWKEEDLHSKVVILPDGTISFPLIGRIPAATKTTEELVNLLKEKLSQFIPDAEINIDLLATEGNIIYVIGEVTHPGAIVMKSPMDVMQALSMSGGLTAFARKNNIRILRRESNGLSQTLTFEYGALEDGKNMASNILLQSGDTIVVP